MKLIITPGHGYLRVQDSDVRDAERTHGITISAFSPAKGQYRYLEEDCDLPLYVEALGIDLSDVPVVHRERTPA